MSVSPTVSVGIYGSLFVALSIQLAGCPILVCVHACVRVCTMCERVFVCVREFVFVYVCVIGCFFPFVRERGGMSAFMRALMCVRVKTKKYVEKEYNKQLYIHVYEI